MDLGAIMPIDNLELKNRQSHMFMSKLSQELNKKHKLYKLRGAINWESLEVSVMEILPAASLYGRDRKSVRVLLGLTLLQAMENYSDNAACEMLDENAYWQYFCGYEWGSSRIGVSESCLRRFRQSLGEEGFHLILKELSSVGMRVGSYKKKDLEALIIDTTVQVKNIKYPHDAHLLGKAREELVKLAHCVGIKLNETYAKRYKSCLLKLWRYKADSKAKNRRRLLRHMKTLVGRLIRRVEQQLLEQNIMLSEPLRVVFEKVKKIYRQSFLSKSAKRAYKEAGNKVLYSFHAEEVECIGKGKLSKPYEFGNKVGLAVTGRNNFIVGVKSFHGNPYDGHTLAQTIAAVEQVTEQEAVKIFVDLGYRGNNYTHKSRVYTPYTKKAITPEIKQFQKRRSAIEPVIGHLKQYGRMGRNFLKGVIGDILNPLISAIGFNLRNIARRLTVP